MCVELFLASSDQVDTGKNFLPKSESCTTVRFVRVTYVRTDDPTVETKPRKRDQLPGFSYKTFTPAPIKVAMCSGAPEYEPFNYTWERARVWIACVSKSLNLRHRLVLSSQSMFSCKNFFKVLSILEACINI